MRKTMMLTLLFTTLAAFASVLLLPSALGAPRDDLSSGNQLLGTWTVTVNLPAPMPLQSLQVFTDGGGVAETANQWPSTRTPAYGSWERLEGRLYAVTTVFFRFNPQTGAYLGTQRIDSTRRLSEDGRSFTAVARVTVFDPNGDVVASFAATASGERLHVERIPDQP